jgi:hypothetical protein
MQSLCILYLHLAIHLLHICSLHANMLVTHLHLRSVLQQLQALQHQREQESRQAAEELKNLHMQLALQQEQFEKQRSLMVQQRDGVQKGFEQELDEAADKQTELISKNQQLEAQIAQVSFLFRRK